MPKCVGAKPTCTCTCIESFFSKKSMVVTFKDSIVVCFILDVPALEVEGFNWSGVGLIITNRSIVLSSRKYSAKI